LTKKQQQFLVKSLHQTSQWAFELCSREKTPRNPRYNLKLGFFKTETPSITIYEIELVLFNIMFEKVSRTGGFVNLQNCP
jgi:hypothetical protein